MPKKRKLNSTNPKYAKQEESAKVHREFVHEVKGIKIYKLKFL